jgi:hypothetical protein
MAAFVENTVPIGVHGGTSGPKTSSIEKVVITVVSTQSSQAINAGSAERHLLPLRTAFTAPAIGTRHSDGTSGHSCNWFGYRAPLAVYRANLLFSMFKTKCTNTVR